MIRRSLAGIAGKAAFAGWSTLPSRVSPIDDGQADTTTGNKKPSLRRVAPEGFVAAPIYRPKQTDVQKLQGFAGCEIN